MNEKAFVVLAISKFEETALQVIQQLKEDGILVNIGDKHFATWILDKTTLE